MMTTGELGASTASVSVAAIPSMPGILTSINTTCGDNCRVTSIPVRPSPAVPTTSMSSSKESNFLRFSRVLAMSSTTTTRIIVLSATVLTTTYRLFPGCARPSGSDVEAKEVLQHLRTTGIVACRRRRAVRIGGPAVQDRLVGSQLILRLDQRELILGQSGRVGEDLSLGGLGGRAVAGQALEGGVVLVVLLVGCVVGRGGSGYPLLRRLQVLLDDGVDGAARDAGLRVLVRRGRTDRHVAVAIVGAGPQGDRVDHAGVDHLGDAQRLAASQLEDDESAAARGTAGSSSSRGRRPDADDRKVLEGEFRVPTAVDADDVNPVAHLQVTGDRLMGGDRAGHRHLPRGQVEVSERR